MAPKQKRPSPLDSDSDDDQEPSSQQRNHRQAEENDEEETSSDEQGDEDDDEDDEEEEDQPSQSLQAASKNPQPQTPNSHPKPSSSESDSATESDSETDRAPPKIKPLASATKPKDQTPKAKPQSSSAKSASKRPAENNGHSSDPKRAKKKVSKDSSAAAASDEEEADEDAKKPSDKKLFQRLFSEEDEIAILKGMVEFSSKMKGADPLKCAEAFHDFMKGSKSLGFDASCNQLKQKMRRLKKKFENNAGRGKNGEGPSFSKQHEHKSFELSKKVWGKREESSNEKSLSGILEKKSNSKSPAKPKPEAKAKPNSEPQTLSTDYKQSRKADEKIETSLAVSSMLRFENAVSLGGLGEDLVRARVELIEPSKREELEGKWSELLDAEMELCARRAQLIAEQAKLMLQAKKTSKN